MTGNAYTVQEVADRIETILGERPSINAIHRANARADQRPNARLRLTAGMPPPLPPNGHRPLLFSAPQVEAWLQNHPRLRQSQLLTVLAKQARTPHGRRVAVITARTEGLSWAQIATVLSDVDGRPITRQAVAKRYGGDT